MSIRSSPALGRASADDAALDAIFSALSDRTRRQILTRLSDGGATVGELAAPFSMTLPAVSKHIRILEDAGLLRRERDGWYHRCRLRGQPLEAAGAFIDRYRSFWGETLDELARYVATDAATKRPGPSEALRRRRPTPRERRK
ncbi:MAG TPA: metalloregulator ArsR/SmtB family transcription factor [Polyangia bacterium]|jgi:DNA-binding transcriptional ArsR family regulator|nr:metalloregulator ArsR/SmtB family transcription factor [Polyangia bacterium]